MYTAADFRWTTRAEHAFRDRHVLEETTLTREPLDLVHTRRVFVRGCSFLHHFFLSKHSLSQRTRLTERRVLACSRLILAHSGIPDLRTDHPFFDPFGRPKSPPRPLFL
jgi:hypothetical protein